MKMKRIKRRIAAFVLTLTLLAGFVPSQVLAGGTDSLQSLTSASVSDTKNSVDRVYDLMYSLQVENDATGKTGGGFTWDTEGKKRSWTYYNGIMMDAFLMADEDFFAYVNSFYESNITNQGKVNNDVANDNYYRENELDSIPPARALFDLLRDGRIQSGDAEKYRKMIDYICFVMKSYDRVDGTDGNFKHKMDNANWETYQLALDGLYMAQPFFMEVANAIDDGTLSRSDFQYYSGEAPSADSIYTEVTGRMLWIGENLYVPETQLYSHGWGPDAELSRQYWLRAVGWYAAALADVISMLPDRYDEGRSELIAIEKRLFDGMLKYADEATGMWYNVINYGPELSGSSSSNELETSGSALMAYAMMKSYVEGYLDDTYGEAGLRAFNGTVMNYLDGDGLHNVYISSGVETTPKGYLSKEYKVNEAKGVGPLIMAATYANDAAQIHNAPSASLSGDKELTAEINNTPDFSGVSAVISHSNGTSITVKSSGLEFGEYDPAKTGRQEIEVYYRGILCGKVGVTFKAPESGGEEGKSSSSSSSGATAGGEEGKSSSSSSGATAGGEEDKSSSSSSGATAGGEEGKSSSSSSSGATAGGEEGKSSSSSSSGATAGGEEDKSSSSSSSGASAGGEEGKSSSSSSGASAGGEEGKSSSSSSGASAGGEEGKSSSSSSGATAGGEENDTPPADRKDSDSSSSAATKPQDGDTGKDSYSGSEKRVSEPVQPVNISVGGVSVPVSVEVDYDSETVYSGEALTPESVGLYTDVSGLEDLAKAAIAGSQGQSVDAGSLFAVSYKTKGRKGAGETVFTPKIKFDKKQAKQLGMTADDIKALAGAVKDLNKSLKLNPARVKVAKADLAGCLESVKGSFDAKGKLKISAVTVKLSGKSVALKKKDYKVISSDPESHTVTLEGQKNYEGTVTAAVE